jgi:hypothetical protein
MILGMSVHAFTVLHVIISLVGIATGVVVLLGMLGGKKIAGWTGVFLLTTVLTSVTGFLFHSAKFGAPHVVGVISLAVLAPAIAGLYVFRLAGSWRWVYIVGSVAALYLNAFVGVVQAFQKLPFLTPLAPTQSTEPAFVVAQVALVALFVAAGVIATKRFHPLAPMPPHRAPATI